ncbi:hypothetical protein NL676_013943 [Syzygium grande]|nr:hypothetical protein NL676_013943 [Syzygium grande]
MIFSRQDGTQVQFKSTKLRKFLCAENSGKATIVANRHQASGWETFRQWRISDKKFNLRVFNKQFVGLQDQGTTVVAVSSTPSTSVTFDIIRKPNDPIRVRLRASNGRFLQVKSLTEVMADYNGGTSRDDNDPSVFEMNTVGGLQGEYQITMARLWPKYCPKTLTGWWMASDQTPLKPFVGGLLNVPDKGFTWAAKYGMKAIVDLHATLGSQNGESHSASRDGCLEWGDSYIQDTEKVIDFLAVRYGNHPALVVNELMNEPLAPDVKLEDLIKYYRLGYEAMRRHTLNAYVTLSNRLGPADQQELLQFAGGLSRVVIDVHYYNFYHPKFKQWKLQQNIYCIYNNRASDLSKVTKANGPLSFVGECTSALVFDGATKEDSGKFTKAQQEVYGRASFGWAYWPYRCQYDAWNLKQMIQDGLIKI